MWWVSGTAHFLHANVSHLFSISAALVLTVLGFYPVIHFVGHGWKIKHEETFGKFSGDVEKLYMARFCRGVSASFEEICSKRYGRQNFVLPGILFCLAMAAGVLLLCEAGISQFYLVWGTHHEPLQRFQSGLTPLLGIPAVPSAAIAGAYMWVVADLITSAYRLTLSPTDVLNAALRLAMAAAIGEALTAIVKEDIAIPIAFAIGVFPLDSVRIVFRRFATKNLDFGTGVSGTEDGPGDLQLLKIDSIDHSIADRLIDADIKTIAQLAYYDPVQLTMKSGLPFDFVTDIQSQALAWIYFKDKLAILSSMGLRGAMEISDLLTNLRREPDSPAVIRAAMVMDEAASAAQMSVPALYNAFEEITDDPYTEFLALIWRVEAKC